MKKLTFAVLLFIGACKDKAPQPAPRADDIPVKATVGGVDLIEYEEPHGAFTVNAPAKWKLDENAMFGPAATFIGPGTRERPASVDIHISHFPNTMDKSGDPKHYYNGFALIETMKNPLTFAKRVIGGREVESYAFEHEFRKLHSQKVEYWRRNDYAIIRVPDGFWAITHSAPSDSYQATYPIFEAVVASFKPGQPLPK